MIILDLINQTRINSGLQPLRKSNQLAAAAFRHAYDIATNSIHTLDPNLYHEGSDGSNILDRIAATRYPASQWREITGWGFGGDDTAMITYWMNSPTHRAIILDPAITEAGVAYLQLSGTMWLFYWVVVFARPYAAPPCRE